MDSLNLKQISNRIESLRSNSQKSKIRTGWIKCIRQALKMKSSQLADRLNISQGALSELEKREETGALTLKKLEEAAEALNCEVIYYLLPKESLEDVVEKQASLKAARILNKASEHMELEDQKVETTFSEKLERLKSKLIQKGDIW
jgi:predicted DNA-binding mobile mystery protein A